MQRLRRLLVHRAVLALVAGTALTAAVTAFPPIAASAQSTLALSDLSGSEQLRTRFNEDRGHVRLVLLLSPT